MQVLDEIAPSQEKKFEIECKGFELSELEGFALVEYGFFLLERKESLSAKEFAALLREHGKERREANKLIKLAELAKAHSFSAEDLAGLGTMMLSLTTPSNAPVWEAMKHLEELTQLKVSALKKELRPPAKRASKPVPDPRSILRQEQRSGNRYGQLNKIHDQKLITNLERIFVEDGVTQTQFLQDAVSHYESQKAEPQAQLNTYIEKKPISLEASTSQVRIAASLASLCVADNQQANAHAELSIEEQAIATAATSDIHVSFDTPKEQTNEVRESQLEMPANKQMIAQAELNNHIEEQEQAITPKATIFRQVTTTENARVSATSVFEGLIPPGTEIENSLSHEQLRAIHPLESLIPDARETTNKNFMEWNEAVYLTASLETAPEAIQWHQIDWVSLPSLEKAFKKLTFRVKNIQEGLCAPWIDGCQFLSVADFGNDFKEIWIFISPTQQKILVVDRKDFQVVV